MAEWAISLLQIARQFKSNIYFHLGPPWMLTIWVAQVANLSLLEKNNYRRIQRAKLTRADPGSSPLRSAPSTSESPEWFRAQSWYFSNKSTVTPDRQNMDFLDRGKDLPSADQQKSEWQKHQLEQLLQPDKNWKQNTKFINQNFHATKHCSIKTWRAPEIHCKR